MKNQIISTILFSCLFVTMAMANSSDIKPTTLFQKIVEDKVIQITFQTDFDELESERNNNIEEKAVLVFHSEDGKAENLSAKVRYRGVFRRQFCDFPPMRLNFSKDELESLGLNPKYDKLKLVTHCMDADEDDQVLLKEYYAYKLYNEITPNSFKVHLVKINYVNIRNSAEKLERMAFLIESTNEMAKRAGDKDIDQLNLDGADVDAESYHNTMMFNYMIGNLDWSLRKQRNVKLVQTKGTPKLTVVPYDFDQTVLVRPSYARLNMDYGQENYEDRFCIGRFPNEVGHFCS